MQFSNVLALTALNCLLNFVTCKKMLMFFPGGTYSHKVSIWPYVIALADKGHEVTFVSPFRAKPREHSGVRDITPEFLEKAMVAQFHAKDRLSGRLRYEERVVFDNYNFDVGHLCEGLFKSVKTDETLFKIFFNETFDLMVNNAILGECGYALAGRLMKERGTKLIVFDSTYLVVWWAELWGYPAEMSWIPDGAPIGNFPMNFFERFKNTFLPLNWYLARKWSLMPKIGALAAEMYGLDEPMDIHGIEQSASLLFVSSHYSTDFARSVPPFVVHIGGMQCWEEQKPLEEKYKVLLDEATDGAILIAFGSTVDLSSAPEKFRTLLLNTTKAFPSIKFIWRWPGTPPENFSSNNIFEKWLPQFEILGHPNLKTFISHAGLNSVMEATFHGVPPILLPLFADQDYNGYRLQAYETGIRLEVRELTQEKLENAIHEILKNNKYRSNMEKTSQLLKDRPMNPIELAVYWTEFVLRHNDTSSLKPLVHLHWTQRNFLDVFFIASAVGAAGIVLALKICHDGCF